MKGIFVLGWIVAVFAALANALSESPALSPLGSGMVIVVITTLAVLGVAWTDVRQERLDDRLPAPEDKDDMFITMINHDERSRSILKRL